MESSLPWTVESTLFGCVIWLIVSLAAATWLHPPLFLCPLCIMLRIKAFLRLSLSATSLPSSFTILSGPLPLRSPYSCICSDAFGCISHSVFTCCIDHSLHYGRIRLLPIQARYRCCYACVCSLLFVVTCNCPSIPYRRLVTGM